MEILSIHIVEIKNGNSEREFIILSKGKEVGSVVISEKGEIYFELEPESRHKHFATNALFILMPYIHEHLHEPIIHAVIPVENEIAKHVVEHNGYEIVSKDSNNIYYEHRIYETRLDDDYIPSDGLKVIYLAGGCFWGMERAFKELKGVVETKVGYANGHIKNPTYEEVCRHETGFRETIRLSYDPKITSTETILKAYFICIDPTRSDGQGGDIGEQYLSGIYYKDKDLEPIVTAYLNVEKDKYPEFHVENKMLDCFYEAEEYHQDYLLKNPSGYCHISRVEIDKIRALN